MRPRQTCQGRWLRPQRATDSSLRVGEPRAMVEAIVPEELRHLGFLPGKGAIPEVFDRIGAEEFTETFLK